MQIINNVLTPTNSYEVENLGGIWKSHKSLLRCPGSGQDTVHSCNSQEGAWPQHKGYTTSLPGVGEGSLSHGERAPSSGMERWGNTSSEPEGAVRETPVPRARGSGQGGVTAGSSSMVSIFACESLALLYTFVINTVAVTVPFLILLLFPVTCSYLNS